jgi:hypothetical protein
MEYDLSNKLIRLLARAGGPLRLAQICAALGVVGSQRGYSARDKAARRAIRRELSDLERAGRAERLDVDDPSAGWQWIRARSSTGQVSMARISEARITATQMFWESLF